ncbi:MAG: hypothetical protein J0H98_07630 [Solirubrobacterales bacterium]|nr:hypothetical protein [Solirubrobacterales bacterium]
MKLGRVHPGEWLVGLLGLAVLAGLILPWSGGSAALSSPGLLDLILLVVAAAAVLLPLIVARSSRTDVPVVYETTLWPLSGLVALILIVKAIFPPDSGFDSGFWLALAGIFLMSFTLWRCVGREY